MRTPDLVWSSAVTLGGAGLFLLLASTAAPTWADDATGAAPPSGAPHVADAAEPAGRDSTGSEAAQSRNAARSRMRECGHQWSAMKKNGSASGMTWKDFSQGCLAKQ